MIGFDAKATWNPAALNRRVQRGMKRNTKDAAGLYRTRLATALGQNQGTVNHFITVYDPVKHPYRLDWDEPYIHSLPGQVPFTVTGDLIASLTITMSVAGMEAIVGSDLPHARFLETGTIWMAPRPFWRRILWSSSHDLHVEWCKPI